MENLPEIAKALVTETCTNLTNNLVKVRTEILTVQARGNEEKAKARLAASCVEWITHLKTCMSSSHWPGCRRGQMRVIINMLSGIGQGAEDSDVPFDVLGADCKTAAGLLRAIIDKLPSDMAPKVKKRHGTLEEDPYDYTVGEGSDIIGDFDVSALEKHAREVSRVPGVNNIQNAPKCIPIQVPLIVSFSSYRTPDVFRAQGLDVSDIGGHLCFEDQNVLCFNMTVLGDDADEYIQATLEKHLKDGHSLAYESPFYFDNHQWRMYWLVPTKLLSCWLRTSTIPTQVGLAFAHREKPVNPNLLKNMRRRKHGASS